MVGRRNTRRISGWLGAWALITTIGCGSDRPPEKDSPTAGELFFTDVAVESGIAHRHHKPVLDPQLDNIMPWMTSVGAAVAAGDYNRDGRIDLYVTNSRQGEPNFLYRNDGAGTDGRVTFTDVASASSLADLNGADGVSMDAVWGDVDNDGWPDLYLVRWGHDSLFRNQGDGTFAEVTAERFRRRDGSPGTEWANGNAAIFLDYDLDGRLDLYVGNYFREVNLWHLTDTRIMHDDFERSRNAGRNFLYHQEDDGTFTETAASLGLDDPGWTLAVGAADVDNDGWPDLYCANDFGPDRLFLNRGRIANAVTFVDASDSALGFDTKKGMNVDFGDFNNDGWLDVYVTNITTAEYLQEGNMLWYNNGLGPDGTVTLTDVSQETGTWDGGWGWGAKFFDYDLDGDLDLVSVNGFISAGEDSYWYDLASWTVTGKDTVDARNWPPIGERSFSGYERMRLWRNEELSVFTEVSRKAGLSSTRDGRGIAVVDYDDDGDPDLFIANQGQAPHLYRNDQRTGHHWLTVALEADPTTGVNRDGIGTRVTVVTQDGRLIRERDGGNGFAGQSDPRLQFGLGGEERLPLVEVRWPDGGLQYLEEVPVDQILTLRQDPGQYASRVRLDGAAPLRWTGAQEPLEPAPPEIEPEELERQLAALEERLRQEPIEWALASAYRHRAATYGRHDRAIGFLEGLADQRPNDGRLRIELSLAYVDKIPTCGGLAAIVCKGSLAKKGLDQLDRVIAEHPDSWLACYSRGMNHLHWPRALRHSGDAARDFEHTIELQERKGGSKPYGVRVWAALGDAYTKAGECDEARRAWRRGLERFPDAPELRERDVLSGDEEILAYVEAKRSLEQRIDTDLSFYDGEL